jgi:P27 family predicted phage terminase small subunit
MNKNEPEPEHGIPSMPGWLMEFPRAVEEWNRESVILDNMGLMTVAEGPLLANRCYIMAQIEEMALEIKNEGRVVYQQKMDSLGNEIMEAKTNPKANQIAKLLTEHRQYGSLLGLDASARAKMSIDPGWKKKSKYQGLIGGQANKH